MAPNPTRSRSIPPRRILWIAFVSILVAGLTALITSLPKFELVEAAMNDDNFTDIVLQTRGELPIDTNIRVLTYNQSIFDSLDRVDRAALAMRLAALLELEPRTVAVDFLIEDQRPEAPDGDEMLKSLIAAHPNLLFGVFHEDSLDKFRLPPTWFAIPDSQLGCINLQEDDDRTMRTYTTIWGNPDKKQIESFDLRAARRVNPDAVAHLQSFSGTTFVIDYAAGIGEVQRDGGAQQIFPVIPLDSVFNGLLSGDSIVRGVYAELLSGKTILVGYGDLRPGQVTSVVDRFYTPLKPGKNSLPDMHGVAIHANILNSILKRRILQVMPLPVNVLWGACMVMALLLWRERLERVANPTRRTVLFYIGLATLFVLGVLLPILAFRYTPYKFSIYTPLAGILLAVPTIEALGRGIGFAHDLLRRTRLGAAVSPRMRTSLVALLRPWSIDERLQGATHLLQYEFSRTCDILLHLSLDEPSIRFSPETIASPTLPRIQRDLQAIPKESLATIPSAAEAKRRIELLASDPLLSTSLRLSRSLYIALNEIRRQTATADEITDEELSEQEILAATEYADIALKTLTSGADEMALERFNALFKSLMRYAVAVGVVADDLELQTESYPLAFESRCRLHNENERFVYICTQEDANNRDDFFDLVYGGATIRCQPEEHPTLTDFKKKMAMHEG